VHSERFSDIQYAAVSSISRHVLEELQPNSSAACPSIVMARPIMIASNQISLRADRAPTLRSCFLRELNDGSVSNQWVSEVQLNNHLSMPFVVSAFCTCSVFHPHSFVGQPSLDYLDVLDFGSVATLTYA
jgi:hypothetical protein